jgi:hypothetical protein
MNPQPPVTTSLLSPCWEGGDRACRRPITFVVGVGIWRVRACHRC